VTRTETVIEQRMLNANIGGSVFDTWAGPVQFNVGFEHREEEGEFLPNAFQQQALGRAVAILPNQGEFETDEWFAEAVLPLIKGDWDFPLLHRFDLTGKFRTVDNTVNGSFDTYTYGFQYRPISTLEFRGNRTKSLRAPAITELFTPVSNIFTLVPDPCDARNVNGGTRPSVRLANCQAFYRQFNIANPAVFQSVAVSATIPGTLGGDPNLDNEVAHAETIGVVWQPEELLPGLRIALDYYAIEVDDVIGNLNATAVAEGCFDNTNFDTGDVNNANAFCQRISRDSNGQITGIRTGFVNGGFLDFTGQSLDLQYSRDLGELGFGMKGRIELAANLFRLRRLEDSLNNVVTDNDLREISNPKRQYQYGVGYTLDPIAIGFQANYQSGVIFDNTFTTETRDILELESQWTYDANLAWRFHDQGMLRFTVTNLTDEDPPFPLATLALGVYDTLGRRYSLALDWRW
jgi:outer membrane receptor protein involved in Fe transport